MKSEDIAMLAGAVALALILGALGFQYIFHYPPCEMCHWQRWPHIAAATIGIAGGALVRADLLKASLATPIAALTLLLVAASGALGVYHAGVEWHLWAGPSACTTGYVYDGTLDLNAPVPRCDVAAWRLFGVSMAGYNAAISLGVALLGTFFLVRRT